MLVTMQALSGLREGGVPIKFSSWHTYQFQPSTTLSCLIQERSRSVKSIFSVCRRSPGLLGADSGTCFFSPGSSSTLQNYQYRIGGRYFPASPVQTATTTGSAISNGGAEAFVELQKALNTIGDYRLSSSVNTLKWACAPGVSATNAAISGIEADYVSSATSYSVGGNLAVVNQTTASSSLSGDVGSQAFCMAVSLETSNGLEISGLNAEEQSDISLMANYGGTPFSSPSGMIIEAYTYYDAMLVLRENNVLELIQ
jgi:hypothetical protein